MADKVVNQRLYKETSLRTGIPPSQVEEFFKMTCKFTEETISRGGCETIMWPFFGKFKVKVKQFQMLESIRNQRRQDETIRSERAGGSISEQAMDITDTGISELISD